MKKALLAFGSISLLAVGLFQLNSTPAETEQIVSEESPKIPIPTAVNERMQDEAEFEEHKELYMDIIHGNHPEWEEINKENFRIKVEARIAMMGTKALESYANGAIAGEWFERGSSDQAGNVRITAYDPVDGAAYAIGDGGLLFKGDVVGSSWTAVNDHYLLDPDVLLSVRTPTGDHRLIAAIGNGPHYSDDEGQTWTPSTGFVGSTWDGFAIDLIQLDDADSTIVFLYTYKSVGGGAQNKLAYSKDHGVSFSIEHAFSSSASDLASMCSPHNSTIAYILDNDDDVWVFQYDSVYQIADAMALQGGGSCQIEVSTNATDTVLYILMDQQHLYKSTDAGYNFTQLADLPVTSWDVGIGTSIDNVDAVYMGEVDLWHSLDGGNSFNKVSDWWEYYGDPANFVHADIMNLQSYKNSGGTEFTLISNHGGVHLSQNNLNSVVNIGLSELNVGQYYDVATSPINSSLIMVGTQDQGLQRTLSGTATTTVGFEQVISGDYGAQQYSNNGVSFWTEYPFGDFSYYPNAQVGGSAYWYQIDGTDQPNGGWIFPSGPAPNPADDYILVGGGNISGGSGSYLIKLENGGGTAIPTQFPFDFLADAGGTISAIETTTLDENRWYVSTANGHFYHSDDAGQNWTEALGVIGPGGNWIYGADIYASKITPDLVFLGGTNYGSSAVYMSEDGGMNFLPLADGDLPNTMVHELCMDIQENFLFAATDAGPYVYDMAQQEWFDLSGADAPIQEYISCEFVETDNLVRFATWGRGVWDFKLADVSGIEEESQANLSINKAFPNPSVGAMTIRVDEYHQAKIYNLQGQEVAHIALLQGDNNLNLSYLGAGTYLLAAMNNAGVVWKEKLVVR